MDSKVWERKRGAIWAQGTVVNQSSVSAIVAAVRALGLGQGELLAVAAALHRESAKEIRSGLVVQATAFVSDEATGQVVTLDADVTVACQVMYGVMDLLREATPELWEQIREVLRAPTEDLKVWLREKAK